MQSFVARIYRVFWWGLYLAYWLTLPLRYVYKVFFGYDVFISYARKDAYDYSTRLENTLHVALICYRDEGDAEAARPLAGIIEQGLLRSNGLIAVLTPEACQSEWVINELTEFKAREDKDRIALGAKCKKRMIFPIFVAPCTPDTLSDKFKWLGDYLGAIEHNSSMPSEETISKIRSAFLGTPRAFRLYGASSVAATIILVLSVAWQSAHMQQIHNAYIAMAANAEAEGRLDHAEWLIAKAAQSDVRSRDADLAQYARVRARRMLIPDGVFNLDADAEVMMLLNTTQGISVLQWNDQSHTLNLCNLRNSSQLTLMDHATEQPRPVLLDGNLFVAMGTQLAWKSLDDDVVHRPITLPGECQKIRVAEDSQIRLLCTKDESISIVFAKLLNRQPQLESLELKGICHPCGGYC